MNILKYQKLALVPLGARASSPNVFGWDDAAIIAGSLLAAGGSAVAASTSSRAATNLNKTNREWQEKMYGIERADAVEDRDLSWSHQQDLLAYNSPTAARKRIEDAGYNPFLYGGDSGNSTTGVTGNTGSVPSVPSPSTTDAGVNAWPSAINNTGGLFSNLVGTLSDSLLKSSQQKGQNIQNEKEKLSLEQIARQSGLKLSDLGLDGYGDLTVYDAEAAFRISDAKLSISQKENQDIQNVIDGIQQGVMQMTAIGNDGQPILNSDGSEMTVAQAKGQAEVKQMYATLDKAFAEIRNLDFDSAIKKFENMHLQPAQLSQIKATIENLRSQSALNRANIDNLDYLNKQIKAVTDKTNAEYNGVKWDNQYKARSLYYRVGADRQKMWSPGIFNTGFSISNGPAFENTYLPFSGSYIPSSSHQQAKYKEWKKTHSRVGAMPNWEGYD